MPVDDRIVLHFVVPVAAGAPGLPSSLPKNVAALPPALQKALANVSGKVCFACLPNLASSLRHHGTPMQGLVNCLLCRKTKIFQESPLCGPFPRNPGEPEGDEDVGVFLEEPKEGVAVPAEEAPAVAV